MTLWHKVFREVKMTLIEWLKKENKRVADMARDMELSHPVVLRWSNGERIPTKENMQRIIAYTNGEVQPNDFYNTADSHA
jgi:transcriptional regulator with XRE-family HTH domain